MLKTLRNIAQRVFFPDTLYGDIICSTTPAMLNGYFKAVSVSGIGTSTITEPSSSDDSIVLTDLILTTDKTNAAIVKVRFTDGTNTINVVNVDITNDAIAFAIAFGGKWQGWAGARLELDISVAAGNATAACGYLKIDKAHTIQSYSAWDALR